jgi:hypothetical protein
VPLAQLALPELPELPELQDLPARLDQQVPQDQPALMAILAQ